jgi:hypothetical protein
MGEAKRKKTAKHANPNILIIRLGEWEDETGLLVFNLDEEPLREILQNVEQKYPAAPKDRLLHLAKVLIALRIARENKCGRAKDHSVEQLKNMIPKSHIEEILGPIQ